MQHAIKRPYYTLRIIQTLRRFGITQCLALLALGIAVTYLIQCI